MHRLDPDTIKDGPAFILRMGEQYEARAAKPIIASLRNAFPDARIYGVIGQYPEETVRGWLGESADSVTFRTGSEGDMESAGRPSIFIRVPMLFHSFDPDDDYSGKWVGKMYEVSVNPELVKFEVDCPVPDEAKRRLRSELGTENKFVVVAGSLADTGFEDSVTVEEWFGIHSRIAGENPGAEVVSVIVPRNPERLAALPKDPDIIRLTDIRAGKAKPPEKGSYIVVADTFGELPEMYSMADAAYVNGEHNILEPAEQGAAVVYMKGNMSFPRAVRGLEDAGGGIPLQSTAKIPETLNHLIAHRAQTKEMGAKAKRYKDDNAGVSERLTEHLREIVAEYNAPKTWRRRLGLQ